MNYLQTAKRYLGTTTAHLALSYLAIIMLMSIAFSVVFYNTSSRALGRQLPPPNSFVIRQQSDFFNSQNDVNDFFRRRIDEGRHALLTRLITLNLLVLVGGSALSFYLARRTLKPIEENMEAQSQFVSDASHELRTPLTALKTTNEVAMRKAKVSSKDAHEIFSHNVEQVDKLQLLTTSLLNLAKNENGDLDFKPIKLNTVVSDALNTIVDFAVSKKIAVEDDVPEIIINADKMSITQALTTVLDNAVKYSPEDSIIYINAHTNSRYAFLNVRDEGVGIKAVHLPHIFDRFYRVDASRNKSSNDGFGIGLSLAKKILEQHHGEIIAASTPGKGSTFTLKIPLSKL